MKPSAHIQKIVKNPVHTVVFEDILDADMGVLFLKNGQQIIGEKKEIFERAKKEHDRGRLEAFFILDKQNGLLYSEGTIDTALGVHGGKHARGHTKLHVLHSKGNAEFIGEWKVLAYFNSFTKTQER